MIGAERLTSEQKILRRMQKRIDESPVPIGVWYRVRLSPRKFWFFGGALVYFADGVQRRVYDEEVWAYTEVLYFAAYDALPRRTVYAYTAEAQVLVISRLNEF